MRIPLLLPCRALLAAPPGPTTVPTPGADALVLALGEAAPAGDPAAGDRAAARRAVAAELVRTRGGPPRIVVLGPLRDDLVDPDLDAVMPACPDAVLLRGAVGGRDIQHLGAKLAVREAELGRPAGVTGILAAAADTPAGVLALAGLAGASPRLRALVWDGGRLSRALWLADAAAGPVIQARSLLVIAAAAAGVPALAMPEPGVPLAGVCAAAARDGFAGMVAHDPGEVPVIARWFPGGTG